MEGKQFADKGRYVLSVVVGRGRVGVSPVRV